jgi:hypothetical protein
MLYVTEDEYGGERPISKSGRICRLREESKRDSKRKNKRESNYARRLREGFELMEEEEYIFGD